MLKNTEEHTHHEHENESFTTCLFKAIQNKKLSCCCDSRSTAYDVTTDRYLEGMWSA